MDGRLSIPVQTPGVPANRPSITAEWMALIRAAEQRRPLGRRVVDDPFAARFLEAAEAPFARGGVHGPLARAVVRVFEMPLVGLASFHLARHRVLDDLLLAETRAGAAQCVILGAGYDARAYRFPPGGGGPARFFEVDHPTLSARKRALVERALGGAAPPHVRFVTVDFLRERLDERLRAEGYDPGARTVWIWEGVTMYLTREANAAALAAIAALGPPGSVVGFDLWRAPRGLDPVGAAQRAVSRPFLRAIGEPILFSFGERDDDAPEAMLARAGFETIFRHDSAALQAIFATHAGRRRALLEGRVAPHMEVVAGRLLRPLA